jgi:hypothetical protein
MRNAEADRVATCPFANTIADVAIATYKQYCPPHIRYKQTVLAAFVLQHEETGLLRVVSFGVGTKVLPMQMCTEIQDDGSQRKTAKRVRDCHAEVLARRGLIKYLLAELKLFPTTSETENPSIFERCRDGLFKLRDGYSIHMYTSSQPCGNATIKKWAKSVKPKFQPEFETTFPPVLTQHPKFYPTGIPQGEVSLLVKRNNSQVSEAKGYQGLDLSGRPEAFHPEAVPAGTAVVGAGLGNIMTCSDKIAKWNALGVQGSLLSNVMTPIYVASISVGRKFSQKHCERALCCRIQDFSFESTVQVSSTSLDEPRDCFRTRDADEIEAPGWSQSKRPATRVHYYTHHPAMMCASVKFDESAIVTIAHVRQVESASSHCGCTGAVTAIADGVSSNEVAVPVFEPQPVANVGAVFDEFRSLCWWLECGPAYRIEVIDGRTGLRVDGDSPSDGRAVLDACCDISSEQILLDYSGLLAALFADIPPCAAAVPNYNRKVDTTLGQAYQEAKAALFSDRYCFSGWNNK